MRIISSINDLLALLTLIVIIPGLWVGVGCGWLNLPGEIVGATIMGWTLVLQFYFRKKKTEFEGK
ncbi:hypothetical protein ES706_04894 [subsurface metagenome]